MCQIYMNPKFKDMSILSLCVALTNMLNPASKNKTKIPTGSVKFL